MRSDEFMNAMDVARYLHLGKNTVYQLAKSGKLASYRVGRKLKFTLEDVEAYVASTHQATNAHGAAKQAPAAKRLPQPVSKAEKKGGHELSDAASFGCVDGEPFVIAGDDSVADMLAGALNACGVPTVHAMRGCYTALVNLYAGDADAAVVHLYDQASNSYNIPYVRRLAPGVSVVIFRLYGRKQGLIVGQGNPKKLSTWGSLLRKGVRLSNRQKGSGSRVLLDEKLRAMEVRSEVLEGYNAQYPIADTAIRRVAAGVADVTLGTEREARSVVGVDFVPLQDEWVDLVVRKSPETRAVLRRLKDIVASDRLQRDMEALQPCDMSKLGAIVFES